MPISFNQGGYTCPGGYYCYINSPGMNQVDTMDASFWSLGSGDPTVGSGDDSGSWANSGWLTRYSPSYGIYITPGANWAASAQIDGCIDSKIPAGHANEVMVIAFSDPTPTGAWSFFAAAAVERDRSASPQFDFSVGNQDINLVLIERPSILDFDVRSSVEVDVGCLGCPEKGAGFYTDGTTAASEVIKGCRIFQQTLPWDSAPPSGPNSRDQAGWTDTGVVVPCGLVSTVSLTCVEDSAIYLATSIEFDSGFNTKFVSQNRLVNTGAPLSCGQCAAADGANLLIEDETFLAETEFVVCDTITVGPNVGVMGPDGHLVLRAGVAVVFGEDVLVGVDGELTVRIEPVLIP